MTRYQILLFPTLAAAIFALGGALQQKPAAPQAPPSTAPSAANDPQALEVLDQAAAALAPEHVAWLETKVWQNVCCEDFAYQACGRLVMAPGDRSRFDLNVKVGSSLGELRLVNDGKTVWQSVRIGGGDTAVKRWDMPVIDESITTPAALAQARAQFMQAQGVAGLAPMLRTMRQSMQNTQLRRTQWHGQEVQVITAAWPSNAALAGAAEVVPPRMAIRQCRVYLDAATLWPHRVEWWGGSGPGKPDQLVMETEYRSPVLNQVLSEERCAAEFTFGGT
ncbi:MAG TPA: hypothetical protein VE988_02970 [Gemmataceae bacterium]|nr:hypothetical protein [Gemmataceae bacterium]